MKASVRLALAHIDQQYHPATNDAWLLAPADMPRLHTDIFARVLWAYEATQPTPIAPMFQGRRGHPIAFPWQQAKDVHGLGESEGVNSMIARTAFRPLHFHGPEILDNINAPTDYDRMLAVWNARARDAGETSLPTPGF